MGTWGPSGVPSRLLPLTKEEGSFYRFAPILGGGLLLPFCSEMGELLPYLHPMGRSHRAGIIGSAGGQGLVGTPVSARAAGRVAKTCFVRKPTTHKAAQCIHHAAATPAKGAPHAVFARRGRLGFSIMVCRRSRAPA